MIGGNQDTRVEFPASLVQGPLPGSELFSAFKAECIKERVFQLMFGDCGERIFVHQNPNLNETILPALMLSWKQETFMSNNTTLEGTAEAWIILPLRLRGDYNALRRVGSIFQRWLSGGMSLFDKVPGLTKFGFSSTFDYSGLAAFDGFTATVIQVQLPFRFDLQLMRLQSTYDPNAPLDEADVGFIETILLEVINGETKAAIFAEGVIVETGQVNT